ncbi:MAG: 50S ribosomal protein L13 [Candidatus Buchananbacteria bacterium CG10_big_fil_rev_8_21_14_0_10_42_9]|uniref:Large ribosomal subunit protein uL13 n=1 Tax=Candidatus Buchananbacteria bacterium CG10_big_fil_rev_8_21_14_0_10_42_9 TaxID=1974526 RepID=A0A2H0W108_9BACT|nr:MAG: 50S ribosomal protein L13 [Candidatus Buchananbacteria bacterium CG10_big_fil_rev_8_21_14_0_10_42_9]
MPLKIQRKTYSIDASERSIGRLASEIATKLMGKDRADYTPNADSGAFVTVENIKQARFSGKKFDQKIFYHHSGYPGGIKQTKLSHLFKQKPEEVLKRAVINMLPNNKLRKDRIKRLTFK